MILKTREVRIDKKIKKCKIITLLYSLLKHLSRGSFSARLAVERPATGSIGS